jgi:hypothetical protein
MTKHQIAIDNARARLLEADIRYHSANMLLADVKAKVIKVSAERLAAFEAFQKLSLYEKHS